jgi:hypothetical protein
MGWFKVHSDDLHRVVSEEVGEATNTEATEIKTKDVKVFICGYGTDHHCYDYQKYISGELMTKTNARDAFMKGVQELMKNKNFDPTTPYRIKVATKTIKEPV